MLPNLRFVHSVLSSHYKAGRFDQLRRLLMAYGGATYFDVASQTRLARLHIANLYLYEFEVSGESKSFGRCVTMHAELIEAGNDLIAAYAATCLCFLRGRYSGHKRLAKKWPLTDEKLVRRASELAKRYPHMTRLRESIGSVPRWETYTNPKMGKTNRLTVVK